MISFTYLFVVLQALILVSQTHGVCVNDVYVQNGKVHYGYSHYEVTCDPGYVIVGNRVVYCVSNEWQIPPPSCTEGTVCPLPQHLNHGTVLGCTSQDLPRIHSKCSFQCNRGYKLRGPPSLTCTSSGTYVDDEGNENFPECVVDNGNRQNVASHRNHNYHSSSGVNEEKPSTSETDDDNPCVNLGGCQHICKNVEGRAKCRCRKGYTLESDQKSCIETPPDSVQYQTYSEPPRLPGSLRSRYPGAVAGYEENRLRNADDPCLNHQCDQLCLNEEGRAQCRCKKGFILNKEDQRSCNKNYGPPIHTRGACDYNNGGCEHRCTLATYGSVKCGCYSGYYLDRNQKNCIALPQRPTRGTCDVNNGGCQYTCSMRSKFAVCSCPTGYKLDTDRKQCVVLTPTPPPPPPETCDVKNGGCQFSCSMKGNSAVCKCPVGYKLHTDRKRCVDIDECRNERLNTCHHICKNTNGGYTCHCRPGYFLTETNKCEGCRKNAYWSTEENGCVDCPENSFTVSDGKTSVIDCYCNQGFIGSPKDNIPCRDVDECAIGNFGCSHTCVNIPGDAFCSCPIGYAVDTDNKTCIDIDECSIKNGGCEGLCYNTDGSFYCKCLPGFASSNKDQYSCDDVDECAENNGGCQQLCINYRGGHNCACEEGYRLDSSLKSCTDILCTALPIPHFSTMKCSKDKQDLDQMDKYPIGTVCKFVCAAGFKDASESNQMECLGDGIWEGHLSECKSQRCPPLKVPENGDVHPSVCATDGNTVKQKCTFTCRQGYKLGGISVFTCKNNLAWNKPMDVIPVCQPEEIRANVECTRDITATLLPGQSSLNITIPKPVTNMESYEIFPEHIVAGQPIEFKAGKTRVLFTASSPSSNRTAKCFTTVHVVDEEPPVFLSCPDPILIENAKVDGEIVTWEEPEVTDNVYVESLKSSVEPNTTLAPGSYVVQYVARDDAGNIASCSFKIDVVRLNCDNLTNPAHGEANCMDWMYGTLCQPQCDDGYIRNPSEPIFYSCDDSGVWEPSNTISDCLPFAEAISSQCPDGWELELIEETGEELCLECPSSAVWSSKTRTCEDVTK